MSVPCQSHLGVLSLAQHTLSTICLVAYCRALAILPLHRGSCLFQASPQTSSYQVSPCSSVLSEVIWLDPVLSWVGAHVLCWCVRPQRPWQLLPLEGAHFSSSYHPCGWIKLVGLHTQQDPRFSCPIYRNTPRIWAHSLLSQHVHQASPLWLWSFLSSCRRMFPGCVVCLTLLARATL